jgi:DNA mismatch repair protein MutS2
VAIDQSLSQAIEHGALWIIHGKGTGKLRQGVHEYLKGHPLVRDFTIASEQDGGSGVTIAYIN